MIQAEGIRFSYGKGRLIRDLGFTAGPGECVVLTGPNGSGKSTLLSLVAGVLKPEAGTIRTEGKLGLVPQGTALFEDMTVEENLLFFAGLTGAAIPKKLPFSLDQYRRRKLSALSGGSKKRVSLACALLGDPANLLFDEPCAGLDILYQQELIRLISSLKAQGRTILYVSHDPQEYVSFFDRLIFLGGSSPQIFDAEQFAGPNGSDYETALQIAGAYRTLCEEAEKESKENTHVRTE